MTRGRGRLAAGLPSSKGSLTRVGDKSRRRASAHGRARQAMGSGGRSGGTKSSGGRMSSAARGGYRGTQRDAAPLR